MRKVFFLFLSAIFLLSVPLGTEIQAAGTIDNYSMWAVEEENDQYTLDIFALSGIAPWDQFTTVSGPNNYDQQNWDYWGYIVRYNYKEGMYYEVKRWMSNPPTDGDYTLDLYQGGSSASINSNTVVGFTNNMLPVVDISTATPVDGSYLSSTTPTLSWTGVTDETATLYYRIYIEDPNESVEAYISDRSTATTATVPSDFLEANRGYKWRVEAFDAATVDAQNVSRSDWSSFFTGSNDPVTVPLSVDYAYMRNRIKTNNRSYTQIGIGVTGPAPEDTTIQVIGPLEAEVALRKTYDLDQADYFWNSYGLQLNEHLADGTYQFTVTDGRPGGSPITTTRSLQANWTQPILEEDDFNIEDSSYLDTDTPTFTWTPLGDFLYRVKIFSIDWGHTLFESEKISQTQITIPENILQKDVAYILRVENYDSNGNRGSSYAPAFFVANDNEPASLSGEALAGASGAGGPIFVVVTDNPVLDAGEDYGFAMLDSPGTYTIYNVPRGKDLYIHAVYDHDNSESYTVGDYRGSYSSTAINLPLTGGTLTGYNITLDTKVLAASVTGTVSCNNYSTGTVYVGAFEHSNDNVPINEVALTAGTGSYEILDLPVGGRFYIKAYWDSDGSGSGGPTTLDQIGENSSNPIIVDSSGNSGIAINIETTGFIAGHVFEDDGTTPIEDLHVFVEDSSTNNWIKGTNTDENGFYYLQLPDATYDVTACTGCNPDQPIPFVQQRQNTVTVADPDVTTVDFTLSSGGTISGTVYEDDGVTPIQNFRIEANLWATGNYAGGTSTDELGNYTLRLDPGNYKVRTCATCEDSPYVDEYYNNSDWNNAAKVEVNLDTDTPDIDFQLSSGGSISGTVFEDDGVTPIQNLRIEAQDSTTGNNAGGTYTDASGDYTLYLNPGSFKVSTCASCDNFPYVDEHYDDSNWDNAAEVEVTLGNDTPNIDFELISGGTISGTVVESDGTTPIDGMWVRAVELSTGYQISGASTDSNGDFTINIAPGTYKVQTCSSCNNHPYLDEYFDNTDQDNAAEIVVTDGNDTPNVDFELSIGGIISGYVYESDETTPIVNLHVYAVDSVTGQWMGSNNTDHLGFYSFAVPTGIYDIKACPTCSDPSFPFANETKNSISVTAPNVSTVNFSLSTGGSISGTVSDDTASLPSGMYISAVSGDPCGHHEYLGRGEINPTTGEYTIVGLPAGDIHLRTETGCNFYIHQTYDEIPSTTGDCDQYDPVVLLENQNVGGKDFNLERGGMITGTVTQSDGSTPIRNLHMMARDSANGNFMTGNNTDDNGYYCLIFDPSDAPEGSNFKVESCAECSGPMPYIDEYYLNKFSWDTADTINVSLNIETPDIDFSLNEIILGDIDGDEDVDLGDLIKGLQIMAGSFPAGTIFTTGDTNGDNRIGMEDLLYIINQL